MEQILRKAGDIRIDSILIINSSGVYQDITLQTMGIQIFEDLYSPFITGTLQVRDSLDLLSALKLSGEDTLHLKLSTPTLPKGNIDHKFYVYKMSNRMPVGDRSVVYTLNFISEEAILDLNKKISKTFSGRCSDIIRTLVTDKTFGLQSSKPTVIEDTSNSTKYISNFWSPIRNITDVCNTSINRNGNGSYVFYESRYGFNFVSLEQLYGQSSFQEFVYDSYVRDLNTDLSSTRNVEEDYKRIRDMSQPSTYDYIDRLGKGMFASKLFTYDPTTKRYGNRNFDMLETFPYQTHLNKNPLTSNNAIYRYGAMINTMSKYTGNFSGYGDVTNVQSMQNRLSSLSQLDSSKLEINVPGRLDYTVGLKVYLKIYKNEPMEETTQQVLNELLSGYYIITAINHYINREVHECTIELSKDSYITNLDDKNG